MELEYTWDIIRISQNPTIETETVVSFNYTGIYNPEVSWSYFGVKSLTTSDPSEILEQLSNMEEIEMMQIRIQKEIKKILNPQNYGLTT